MQGGTMTKVFNSANLLYPRFALQVNSCIDEVKKIGLDVYIFETWRSPERQDLLYNQNPRVTNAQAWNSWHQYGLAADIAFGGPGKWSFKGPYEQVVRLFTARGLRWIGMKDAGHFEYDHSLHLEEAKLLVIKNSVLGVWSRLDSNERREIN